MRHIIESCWDPEPDKRPSMETVAEELIPGLIKNEERDLMPIIKQVTKNLGEDGLREKNLGEGGLREKKSRRMVCEKNQGEDGLRVKDKCLCCF